MELGLPDILKGAIVLVHICYDLWENLHYLAGFEYICIYCSSQDAKTLLHPVITKVSRML